MHNTIYKILAALLGCIFAIEASARTQVSLLTALPGPEVYELEGHTALKFEDTETGATAIVNWGIYDFNAPAFVYRFVSGQTDYLCALSNPEMFMESYRRQGRQVVEQVLDLDSLQTASLLAAVSANLEPQNRVYRYNYVKDNCATRPLLLLEQAVGRQLVAPGDSATTFRREMQHFHRAYPWYQFGIDLALGRRLDAPIGPREAIFAPVTLMNAVAADSIVSETITHGEQTLVHRPTPWLLSPMAVALLVLLLSIAATIYQRKTSNDQRATKIFVSVIFSIFGIMGCIITFLVFVSVHEATSPNLLLLWLNPFCFLGAILPWTRARKATRIYFAINSLAVILLAILAPVLGRYMNPAFWPLMATSVILSLSNICSFKN